MIKKLNNRIKIITFQKKLNKTNIKKIFKNFEIVCDGTDNFDTRYLITIIEENKKILISFHKEIYGQVKFNFKKKGPCYRCFMPENQFR